MQIKAVLQKPYEETQRLKFVVEQSHNQGCQIKETDTALEAWGFSTEEIAEQEKRAQKAELIAQLAALDLKCIRSLRAIQAGTSTDVDISILTELETHATDLRKQIKELED